MCEHWKKNSFISKHPLNNSQPKANFSTNNRSNPNIDEKSCSNNTEGLNSVKMRMSKTCWDLPLMFYQLEKAWRLQELKGLKIFLRTSRWQLNNASFALKISKLVWKWFALTVMLAIICAKHVWILGLKTTKVVRRACMLSNK